MLSNRLFLTQQLTRGKVMSPPEVFSWFLVQGLCRCSDQSSEGLLDQ